MPVKIPPQDNYIQLADGYTTLDSFGNPAAIKVKPLSGDGNAVVGVNPDGVLFRTSSGAGGRAGGDLSGNYPNPTVVGLQNNDIKKQTLGSVQDGYVLTWVNTDQEWEAIPSTGGPPSGPAGGDLSGTYPDPTVAKIQNNAVQSGILGASEDGYVLTWENAAHQWEPKPSSGGGGGGGVSVGNFAGLSSATATLYISTDSPVQNWVLESGIYKPMIEGILGDQPPASSTFSNHINIGGAVISDNNGAIEFSGTNNNSQFHGWGINFSGSNINQTVTAAVCQTGFTYIAANHTQASFSGFGTFFRDPIGGKSLACYVRLYNESDDNYPFTEVVVDLVAWNADNATKTLNIQMPIESANAPVFIRQQLDLTLSHVIAEISRDNVNWVAFSTFSIGGAFDNNPTQAGITYIQEGSGIVGGISGRVLSYRMGNP